MTESASTIQRTYLVLTVVTTLSASFIWGINTLFLLDAGLNNTEAFAANAFYAIGQVLFEVPTGVVADTRGRRFSFLLGAATLLLSTLLYFVMWQVHAPFIGWALASALLGLGFTFFSGATEAWLVDALAATDYAGDLETVFGRAQTASGAAMLTGTVLGGVIAQATDLGVPYLLRAAMLGVTLLVAARFMHDIGFSPRRGASPVTEVRNVVNGAVDARLAEPAGPRADARRPVHLRDRVLRVLRQPAVPAAAVRRSRGVQRRRADGGAVRGGPDPRRSLGREGPPAVPTSDRCHRRRRPW